jgi:hypothetical protein
MGIDDLHKYFTSKRDISIDEFQKKFFVSAPRASNRQKQQREKILFCVDGSIQAYSCLEACRDDLLSFYGEASGDLKGQFVDVFVRRYVRCWLSLFVLLCACNVLLIVFSMTRLIEWGFDVLVVLDGKRPMSKMANQLRMNQRLELIQQLLDAQANEPTKVAAFMRRLVIPTEAMYAQLRVALTAAKVPHKTAPFEAERQIAYDVCQVDFIEYLGLLN